MKTSDSVLGLHNLAGEAYDLIERALDEVPNKGPGPELHYLIKNKDDVTICFQHHLKQKEILKHVDINTLNGMLQPYQWIARIVPVNDQRANPHEIKVILTRCAKGNPPDKSSEASIAVWIAGDYFKASYSELSDSFAVDMPDGIEHMGSSEIDGWVFVPTLLKDVS